MFTAVLILGMTVCLAIGLLAGWLMRGGTAPSAAPPCAHESNTAAAARLVVSRVATEIREVSADVAERIDSHSQVLHSMEAELELSSSSHVPELSVIARLIKANGTLQSQLQEAQRRLRDQAAMLGAEKEDARTDELTRVRNRRALSDELDLRHRQWLAEQQTAGVIMLDLDQFKQLNDTFGHLAGDEVLRSVGRILLKLASIHPRLFTARYGGEEFAVVYHDYSLAQGQEIAEQVRDALSAATTSFEGNILKITASIGVAEFRDQDHVKQVLAAADEAMYAAKRGGGNQVAAYQPPLAAHNSSGLDESTRGEDGSATLIVKMLARRIAEWQRGGPRLSLLLAMLPEGARQSDQAARFEQFLKASLREMDLAVQYEPGVFGILLPTANLQAAAVLAERLRLIWSLHCFGEAEAKCNAAYWGVAEARHEDSGEILLDRARWAAQRAIQKRGTHVFLHDGCRLLAFESRRQETPAVEAAEQSETVALV